MGQNQSNKSDTVDRCNTSDSYGSLVLINKQDPLCIKITQITFEDNLKSSNIKKNNHKVKKSIIIDDISIHRVRVTSTNKTNIECFTDFNPNKKIFMCVLDEINAIALIDINKIHEKTISEYDDANIIRAIIKEPVYNKPPITKSSCTTPQNIVTGKIIKYEFIPKDEYITLVITKLMYICLITQKNIYILDINGAYIQTHPINDPDVIIIDIDFDDNMNIIIFFSKRRFVSDNYFKKIDTDPNCDEDARNYIYSIEYLGKIMNVSYKFFTNESQHNHYPLMTTNDRNGLYLYNMNDLFNIITFVDRDTINPVKLHKISPNKKYIAYIIHDKLYVEFVGKQHSTCTCLPISACNKHPYDAELLLHCVSLVWYALSSKLIVCCFNPNNNISTILMYLIEDYTCICTTTTNISLNSLESPSGSMDLDPGYMLNNDNISQSINTTLIGNIDCNLSYYDMTIDNVYWCDDPCN
jgi:hypothetical protein